MAINAAKLKVDIDASTDGLRSGMNEADTMLGKGVAGMGRFALAAGAAGAAAGAAFGVTAVKGASDLAETMSKVGVVFGEAQGQVQAYANQMAKDFGIPKQAILDATASIGLIGKASGLSQKDAAGMSTQLAQMAVDASSFYNVPLEEALAAIQSGLVGEAEPMRRFGVLLNEDAVAAEALRLGLTKNTKQMTEGMKAQARASLIMRGMTDASGDLARTQDSLSNRLRELRGRVTNFSTSVGTMMLPYVLKAWDATEKWAATMRTKLGPTLDRLRDLARNLGNRDIPGIAVAIGTMFGLMEDSPAVALLSTALQGVVDVAQALAPHLGIITMAVVGLVAAFATVQTVNAAAGAVNGFIDTVAGLPDKAKESVAEVQKLAQTISGLKDKTVSVAQKGAYEARFAVMQLQEALGNLKDKTVEVTAKINEKTGAKAAATGFASGMAGAIGGALVGALVPAGAAIAGALSGALVPILIGVAVVAVAALAWKFREQIGNFLKQVPGWFVTGMKVVANWLRTGLPDLIGQALGLGLGMLLNIFLVWPFQAAEAIIRGAPILWQKFTDLVTGIQARLTAGFLAMVQGVAGFMGMVAAKVAEGIAAVLGWFASLPEKIGAFVLDVRERGIWAFVDLFNGIVSWLAQLPGKAAEFFGRMRDWAVDRLVALVAWIRSWSIVQAIGDILNTVVEGFRKGWQRANDATQGRLGEMIEDIKKIPGRILDAIGNLGGTLYQKGRDLIQGLINGITDMVGKVGDAMGKVTGKIGNFLPGSPVKEGPLSGRHQPYLLGRAVGLQVAEGLASVTPSLNAPMAGLAGGLVGGGGRGTSITIAPGAVQFHGIGSDMDENALTRVVEAGFRQLAREVAVR